MLPSVRRVEGVALFDAAPFEEALVCRVLSYASGLALLRRLCVRMLERLAWRNFTVVARTFLAVVRRRDRRHVPMLGH